MKRIFLNYLSFINVESGLKNTNLKIMIPLKVWQQTREGIVAVSSH